MTVTASHSEDTPARASAAPPRKEIFGAGEMADRIRAFDWASTSIGPIDAWPDTLRIAVNTMLSAFHPLLLLWGPEMVMLYNDAFRPILTDRHPQALGMRGREFWTDVWPVIGAQLESVLRDGLTSSSENALVPILRHGVLIEAYFDYSYSPVFDPDGAISGILVICSETTRRVLAERSLTQMLDASTDGVMTIAPDWSITYLNENARRILAPQGDILGKDFWQTFPSTIYEGSIYVQAYHAAMEQRLPSDFEAFYPAPLDAWYQVNVRPVSAGVTLFFSDITARKRAEAAVQAERTRLLEVFQQAPAFFALLRGPEHVFEMVNPPYQELVGKRDVLSKSVREAIPEAESQGFLNLLDTVYRNAEPFIGHNIPIQLARDSSAALDQRYLDFVYQPLREANGAVTGIIVLGVDVTDRKKAETVLLQTEKLAAVGRLASSIAHEINNPLEAVTNLIYLAQQAAISEDTRHYLQLAELEVRRVSTIANQTLRFYRQSTNPRPVTSAQLIDGTLPLYQGKLGNSHVEVERRDRTARPITCFDGEIRQVLSNLIGNALDAMNTVPAPTRRLLIRSREATDWRSGRLGVLLTVADTGPGMSAQTLPRIFEPFFTTKGISGTGLGLWISHEIVERHHGVFKVRSSQSSNHPGTVFTLFLPCEDTLPAA